MYIWKRKKGRVLLLCLVGILGWFLAGAFSSAEAAPAPRAGNVSVKITGRYEVPDKTAILKAVNAIRQEAVKEELAEPYVPLIWSDGLEEIARQRAAELTLEWAHSRPNGSRTPFLTASNGTENHAENVAKNGSGFARSIAQFYEEKADYLEALRTKADLNNYPKMIGHYTTMIDAEFKSVGAAAFYSPALDYYFVAMEFSRNNTENAITLPTLPKEVLVEVEGSRVRNLKLNVPAKAAQNKAVDFTLSGSVHMVDNTTTNDSEWINLAIMNGAKWSTSPANACRVDGSKVTFATTGKVNFTAQVGNAKVSGTSTVQEDTSISKPSEKDDQPQLKVSRLSGSNREEVAALVARKYFAKAETVLVVNNAAFGDAMSATNLSAGKMPILYTTSTKLPEATRKCLKTLSPSKIIILGGKNSVSSAVESALRQAAPVAKVKRIDGKDRYEVNAKTLSNPKGGTIVVNGTLFSDALMASPLAQRYHAQIALISKNAVPESVARHLQKNGTYLSMYVVGGKNSVSTAAENALGQLVSSKVKRISAANRYELSAVVAKLFPQTKRGILVSGEKFSDALVAAPLAQQWSAPILLTTKANLTDAVQQQISRLDSVTILGGVNSVGKGILSSR